MKKNLYYYSNYYKSANCFYPKQSLFISCPELYRICIFHSCFGQLMTSRKIIATINKTAKKIKITLEYICSY